MDFHYALVTENENTLKMTIT